MRRTKVFLGLLIALVLAYEAYALYGGHATISEAVWSLENGRPVVAFALGFLACHLVRWSK